MHKITDSVFEIAYKCNGRPNPYAISNTLLKKANAIGKNSRESRVIESIILAIDGWFSGILRKRRYSNNL